MARIFEPTKKQEQGYKKWVASRPPAIRAVAEKFEPWSLYRIKPDGHKVFILSFDESEDGKVTLTVVVSAKFNFLAFERRVFGINPNDLEPCELPGPDEIVGAAMTQEEVEGNIDDLRMKVRPDLFVKDPVTGKAVRKQ